MGKMSEISQMVNELRDTAIVINHVADFLTDLFAGSGDTITLEEVRSILAEKSRSGFTAEVRALLEKYGAPKLSEIDPSNYKALLLDAKEINNE